MTAGEAFAVLGLVILFTLTSALSCFYEATRGNPRPGTAPDIVFVLLLRPLVFTLAFLLFAKGVFYVTS